MLKWTRQLYNWVLSWSERPGGERMLFFISLAESSFFPIPPDPLLVALGLGSPRRVLGSPRQPRRRRMRRGGRTTR